mmetsp:Transcript_8429/g.20273  ORF Transcript_8429/g.20273 Transcript_8429/m.20273 type:complete len:149 (-) Transcript_8429:971-1417(-)
MPATYSNVTEPVTELKVPMKAEYSLGDGNASFDGREKECGFINVDNNYASYLQFCLPAYFNNVDAHAVGYDKQSQITDVRRIHKKFGRLFHGHSGPLCLLRGSRTCLHLANNILLQVSIGQQQCRSGCHDCTHQEPKRNRPSVNSWSQ